MKIACIGWGSLIWRPDELKIQNKWFEDGPLLQIEFARHSENDRITLILDINENTIPVRTLWALMSTADLVEAKTSLSEREGSNKLNIHSITANEETDDQVKLLIKKWLTGKDLDAAIWTGLSYSKKTNNTRPSIDYIIDHLKSWTTKKEK